MEHKVGKELYNVMDALAALKIDLECEPHVAADTLVLSATKSRDACAALVSATTSIKKLADMLNGKSSDTTPHH
jgi:hypothetical protein